MECLLEVCVPLHSIDMPSPVFDPLLCHRSETDSDLQALATHCQDLQQLDFLGCGKISPDAIDG